MRLRTKKYIKTNLRIYKNSIYNAWHIEKQNCCLQTIGYGPMYVCFGEYNEVENDRKAYEDMKKLEISNKAIALYSCFDEVLKESWWENDN